MISIKEALRKGEGEVVLRGGSIGREYLKKKSSSFYATPLE